MVARRSAGQGPNGGNGAALDERVRAELARALAQMQHGYITLVVQDGQVIQIDYTHKVRLRSGGADRPAGGAMSTSPVQSRQPWTG